MDFAGIGIGTAAVAFVLVRFGHSIDALEPARQVKIGAVFRAERFERLDAQLAADRAKRGTDRRRVDILRLSSP